MTSRHHWHEPRYVSLGSTAGTPILWKLPESYRCITYGDLAQEERRRRWIARRWLFASLLFVSSYGLASGPWLAAVRTNYLPPGSVPALIIEWSFFPVKVAGAAWPPVRAMLARWHKICDAVFMQRSLTGGWRPTPLWWTWVAAWMLAAYALSPVPAWFAACLVGIERQPGVSAAMSVAFAPLVVWADHSSTVREFYEAYGDWREAVD